MDLQDLEKITKDEWIDTLDIFQQDLVRTLLEKNNEEEAIDMWVRVTGSESTSMFGGVGKNDYLKNFKNEFDKFILEEEKYKDEIKELKNHGNVTKVFIVSFLSNALSKHLGVAASVVSPLIVLALCLIGRIGLNAYRESIKKKK